MGFDEKSGGLLQALKPAAPAWAGFLAAALLWTGVGSFLLYRGLSAAFKLETSLLIAVLAGAAVIGAAKGGGVMIPAARKGAARLTARGDGKCLMGFISWKTWLLVLGMAAFGKLLRSLDLPPWLLGLLLGGVGTGLLIGSWVYWTSFFACVRRDSPPTS